jgi:T-lymphoma invasion and metastasis-inducing protein 1
VRNMSIPATKPTSGGTGSGGSSSGGTGSTEGNGTIPGKPTPMPTSGPGAHNSHTLGKPKKPPKGAHLSQLTLRAQPGPGVTRQLVAGPQRHSAGNIDYDNLETSKDEDGATSGPEGGVVIVSAAGRPFRARSKTVSDGVGKYL